jgi:thioesterase domain-containing protein
MARAPRVHDGLKQLEELITEKMPITQHLQFSLSTGEGEAIVASAPLQANLNHMGSAFGGSISMLTTLTGWAMVHTLLDEMCHKAQILIQESDIEYLQPIRDDLRVVCERPEESAVERFHQMLDRWGRARLELKCKIHEAGDRAVTFIGQYVALAEDRELENGASGQRSVENMET